MKLNNYLKSYKSKTKLSLDYSFVVTSYLLAFFPIMSFALRSIILIFWICLGLFCSYKRGFKVISTKNDKLIMLFLTVSFFSLVLSLFYSDNQSAGIKRLIQMLSFFVIPLIFYFNKSIFSMKRIYWIIKIFCFSVIIIIFYQLLMVVFNLEALTDNLSNIEIKRNNLHHLKTISSEQIYQVKIRRFRSFIIELVDSHPTYQGLWVSFTVFFISYRLKFQKGKKLFALLKIVIVCVLISWLFLILARAPILAMVLTLITMYLTFQKFKFYRSLVIMLALILISTTLYVSVGSIRTKIDEIAKNLFILPTKGNDIYNFNSTNVRNGIYYCASIIAKDNLITGTGIGDMQDELIRCYNERIGAKIYTWHRYNSHNQYFFFLISTGILGLLVFLGLLYTLFIKVIATRNKVMFFFLISLSLVFLTENVLSRSDGVLFFSLFLSMILLEPLRTEKL